MSEGQNNQTLRVGDWYFTPSRNRLSNGVDNVDLEPIASRLLEVLVSEPGRVFSADELVAAVWSDRIVSDNPIYKAMATLRKALGDTSGSPRYVETIRKRGYRLIAEVEAVASTPAQAQTQSTESSADLSKSDGEQRIARWHGLPWVGALLAIVAFAVLWIAREAPDRESLVEPTTGKPMLVVLPFDSDAAFTAPDFLGSGMAQAVAMSLSGASTFGVIGGTSATLVSSRLQDTEEIGESLNARFVLSGVTSRYDDRLVVQVELVDLKVAGNRWAETFEQSVRSGSYVQWRISESLQATLNSWLGQSDQRAEPDRPGRNSLEAYEAFLRGSYLGKQGGVEEKLEAERWLLRALSLDDELMPAIAELSAVEYSLVFYGARTPPEALATLRPWIERSMELEPRAAATYVTVGRSKQIQGLAAEAEEAYQAALAIEPDDPSALSSLAWLYVTSNRGNAAVPLYTRVLKIDPAAPILHVAAAMNAEYLSDYNCSAQLFERAVILK
ncbi:MAG: winged helix-turn-helix domain-containing protein, partial [Pseudomonadota bacterium]